MTDVPRVPDYDDLASASTGPAGTAWGLFGNDLGTLNFVTPGALVRAAQEVRRGVHFSLNLDTTEPNPPILGRKALKRHNIVLSDGGNDDYYDSYFTQSSSQWDSLGHATHPELGFYQGYSAAQVLDPQTPVLGIDQWAQRGIAGRFVLIDVVAYMEKQGQPIDQRSSFAITTELLDEVLHAQKSNIEAGDIVLVNTGWLAWHRRLPEVERVALANAGEQFATPGLDPKEETVRWLWNKRVAAIASDCPALEKMPFDKTHEDGFLHLRIIPKLGFAVGELFELEALALDCAQDHRFTGLLCAAPLNTPGGAGSPANAVALK